jgi:hypothetical protein
MGLTAFNAMRRKAQTEASKPAEKPAPETDANVVAEVVVETMSNGTTKTRAKVKK